MSTEPESGAAPWSGTSAAEIAAAAGATDLFVFRRVERRRFAHVGGVGRGAGWAGIVEIGVEQEPFVDSALSAGSIVRRFEQEPFHIFGPYYASAVAVVPLTPDVFVVFGSPADTISDVSDPDLRELASYASEALREVEPAKRLADELETLNAVRELLHAPAETYAEALQRLADQATVALSCELGLVFIPEQARLVVCDRRSRAPAIDTARATKALAGLAAREQFPLCVQQATTAELPVPFRSADGVLAYYLLELKQPLAGVLLLLHTTAGNARGFTLLCQALGAKLVEASEPLLSAALLRDTLHEQLEQAAAQARRDPLTGLANRLAWTEALASAGPCALQPVTIIQVDCRGLKQINETRGHHIGDQVLRRIAGILIGGVRQDDLVARLGGDEFGVLLCGADEELARTVVERIEKALATERRSGDVEIALAIGHATTTENDLDATQQQADRQMIAAKRAANDTA
jgi:diguanylate cyclase (GGDEF)-like protein